MWTGSQYKKVKEIDKAFHAVFLFLTFFNEILGKGRQTAIKI
jgi:hypothetical protein